MDKSELGVRVGGARSSGFPGWVSKRETLTRITLVLGARQGSWGPWGPLVSTEKGKQVEGHTQKAS